MVGSFEREKAIVVVALLVLYAVGGGIVARGLAAITTALLGLLCVGRVASRAVKPRMTRRALSVSPDRRADLVGSGIVAWGLAAITTGLRTAARRRVARQALRRPTSTGR